MNLSVCFPVELYPVLAAASSSWFFALCLVLAVSLLWMAEGAAGARKLTAGLHRDPEGRPKLFTLHHGNETVLLEPGKSWTKLDSFKWVTRGIIEPPQSFHVLADAAVDLNGEKITLDDPDGIAKLEAEVNKRHAAAASAPVTPQKVAKKQREENDGFPPGKAHFRVRVDHLSHLMIEAVRGSERMETGARGLQTLVVNGLMLKPQTIHLDPLQRGLDIDGVWFDSNEAGAQQLQEFLNAKYAPTVSGDEGTQVEIKENPASATGFDIRFFTLMAGRRVEEKGHLSQDRLEVLQDQSRCEIIRPGILLRLSPPNLLIRRRRADGGEEKVPELPDINYRRCNAAQLQHLLNHPLVRRVSDVAAEAKKAESPDVHEYSSFRLVHNPTNKQLLWLECLPVSGGAPHGFAFTHHNLVDLQKAGIFHSHLDVLLSMDNRTLSVLDKQSQQEEKLAVTPESVDADLARAAALLTSALKPVAPRPPAPAPAPNTPLPPPAPVAEAPATSVTTPAPLAPAAPVASEPPPGLVLEPPTPSAVQPPAAAAPVEVTVAPAPVAPAASVPPAEPPPSAPRVEAKVPVASRSVAAPTPAPPPIPEAKDWFAEVDSLQVILKVFHCLAERLALPIQDVRLSLPRIFTDRRFEVLSFTHAEVESVLELRSEQFYGFYLSHLDAENILLVFACNGRHIEFGPRRCELQVTYNAEPDVFKSPALLGLVQDREEDFVFVVTPAYRAWVKTHEKNYRDVFARFLTLEEIEATPEEFVFIWPDTASPASA